MFQEEMNKIREAENEADRRLASCEATVNKMKEELKERNCVSREEAKKTAIRLKDEAKKEAEEKANALKAETAKTIALEAEKIRVEAEKRLDAAISFIAEGVRKYGSR